MGKKVVVDLVYPRTPKNPMFIVPIGMYCNAELQRAVPGDTIEFANDWQRIRCVLTNKALFRINSREFSFIMRHVYGERMTLRKLINQWESWAIMEGLGKVGFSREECLVLEVGDEEES